MLHSPSSKEEAIERLKICSECPHLWKRKICKKCGCFIPMKVRFQNSKCPIKKW